MKLRNPNFIGSSQFFLPIMNFLEHCIDGLLGIRMELLHLGFNFLQFLFKQLQLVQGVLQLKLGVVASRVPFAGMELGLGQRWFEKRPKITLHSVCDDLLFKPSLNGHARSEGVEPGLVHNQFGSFIGDNHNLVVAQ